MRVDHPLHPLRSPAPQRVRGDAATRGFTLVELMVAMTAGLLVAAAAMVLARGASRTFQQEARITSAQLAATLGMSRLAADIQRASFLSSPHVKRDKEVCSNFANWPPGLEELAGIQITEGGSVSDTANGNLSQSTDNGLDPDSIVIGGAFSTTEQFAVRAIVPEAGGTYSIHLQMDSSPLARARTAASQGAEPICATATQPNVGVFRPGRFLRVLVANYYQYAVINDCTDAGTSVVITLASQPSLFDSRNSNCGFSGHAGGALVNPVSRVRYAIRNMKGHARYGTLVAPPSDTAQATMTGDGHATDYNAAGRTELVRVELRADGTEIESRTEANPALSTLEIVAEYAVDLKFGVSSTIANGNNPSVTRRKIGEAGGYTVAQSIVDAAAAPHRIRSVGVRLSTRARVPDRNLPLSGGLAGGLARFQLSGVPGELTYARLRTLQAEIALSNQAGVLWD